MYSKTALAITSLLAAAEAIKVTSPAKDAEWDVSETNEIKWDSVNTDPKSFEIVVVNQSAYPETSTTIATVQTSDGKYDLKDAKLSAGDKIRINFISTDTQNSGLLAQSETFSLTSDDSSSSASASASATASGSASASGSATASATGTASGTATGSAASGTSTSAPSSASAVKSTFAIFGSVALAAYMLF
ncbi:extracellular conserved serine-rich protein [Colletotrichum kahawae]|uniref:Extracellular conserved serine-rich protein n=1 Tax=Colletotrichum kahawae TaxID=34407 RepID=A0AAE0D372_COLKA|nr:extracellular conserved serine-rich protein [Colletotrichum kahawae]